MADAHCVEALMPPTAASVTARRLHPENLLTMLRSIALIAALALLTGCAATVKKGGEGRPSVRVPAESAQKIVLNISGPPRSTESRDWEAFKGEWNGAFRAQTAAAGIAFDIQAGKARPTGEAGTLLDVNVDDYRYLSPGARYGFGIMTGNAYIESKIRFLDLKTGASFGEQSYNTTSTAWQGVFSAMTEKQVEAIAAEVIREVTGRSASAVARSAPLAPPAAGDRIAASAVTDVDAVPGLGARGKDGYRDWLTKAFPRAFVIGERGRWYATWSTRPRNPADPTDPAARALKHCADAGGTQCALYAVDGKVVYVAAKE